MRVPSLDDLRRYQEQWSIYSHSAEDDLFVAGPPGSGKTSLAIQRGRLLGNLPALDQSGRNRSVGLVTKNRMLAALAGQLGRDVTSITMQSLVTTDYSNRIGGLATQLNRFEIEWDRIIPEYERLRMGPRFDHLIIDEAQNLPPEFFSWARRAGGRFLEIFADEEQATNPEHSSLVDIRDRAGVKNPFRLTLNHRNTPEIAAVAEHFHATAVGLAPASVVRPWSGDEPRLIEIASFEDLAVRVATRLRNRKESIGVIVWTKDEVESVAGLLRSRLRADDRMDAYTSRTAAGDEALIRILDPGVTIITGESAIGLEFDSAFLLDLKRSLPCRDAAAKRRMYMLCSRARDSLVLVNGPEKLSAAALQALPEPPTLKR